VNKKEYTLIYESWGVSEEIRSKVPVSGGEKKETTTTQRQTPPVQQQSQANVDASRNTQQRQVQTATQAQPQTPQKLISSRPSSKMPIVYEQTNVTAVCDTEDFSITDLYMMSPQNMVLWTTVYVTLKPFKQSLWFRNRDRDMKYTIMSGECWFLINQSGAVVTAGMMICVPRENFHMLLNNSGNECRYTFEAPGKLDLREYLRGGGG